MIKCPEAKIGSDEHLNQSHQHLQLKEESELLIQQEAVGILNIAASDKQLPY